MLSFTVLIVLLVPTVLGIGGQCPALCWCPSFHVANCASLFLTKFPAGGQVQLCVGGALLSYIVDAFFQSVRAFERRLDSREESEKIGVMDFIYSKKVF
jgi:hypothetical protein